MAGIDIRPRTGRPKVKLVFDSSLSVIVKTKELLAAGIACLAFLTALYRTNPDWMYSGLGWLDTWYHVAYGLYFRDPNFLNDYYKVSRLPWNLYQYVARHLFAPVPAEIFIQFSTFVASTVLMYYISARLFGRVAGVTLGLFTAALTLLHASGGADYPTQLAGPLFLAVIAAIVWGSAPAASASRYIVVGALLSCLLHTYEGYVFTLPFIVGAGLVFPILSGAAAVRDLPKFVGYTLAGALAMTASLCAINAAFGRGWLFFMPALNYALQLGAHKVPTPWLAWSPSWLLKATQVGFIFGVGLLAIVECVRLLLFRSTPRRGFALCVHVFYLAEVLIWVVLQTRGNSALTPSYVAYPLYGPMFVSLAASLAPRFVDNSYTVPLAFVLVPILFFFGLVGDSTTLWPIRQLTSSGFLLAFIGITGYYAILWMAPRHTIVTMIALAGLPLVNGVTSFKPPDYPPASCHLQLDLYTLMVRNSTFVTSLTGNPENVFVWGDHDELMQLPKDCPQGRHMNEIAYPFASFGHSYIVRDAWPAMPAADQLPLADLREDAQKDAVIVAITQDPSRASQVAARFAAAGTPIYFVATLLPPRGNPLPPFYVYRTQRCVEGTCLPAAKQSTP